MSDLFDLSGCVALVTGSSQGLGRFLAEGLAAAGATVVINGRDTSKVERTVGELRHKGWKSEQSIFDVIDRAAIVTAVDRIEQEIGPVDILVNNAGVQRRSPLVDVEETVWREVLDTNLTGVFLVSQQVARRMISRRRGKIINICSLMSEVGRATIGPYAASKGGVKMLTKAMATEWACHNIQVNGIGPGYFATEMTKSLREDKRFDEWICGRTPAGRWGEPFELVGPVVFLASKASNFVNGQILYVDGGILATL